MSKTEKQSGEKPHSTRRTVRTVLAWCLIIAAIALCLYFKVFSVDTILSITPHNLWLAAIVLLVIYAAKNLSFLFPIAVLYVVGGTVFPLPAALIVNFLGALICTLLPYFFGLKKGDAAIGQRLEKYPKLQKIFEIERGNDWFISYFLRVINILPMDLVSMYLGANKVNFGKYVTGSMLGNLPGIIAITVVGSSITDPTSPTFIVSVSVTAVISAASLGVFLIYKKKKMNVQNESDQEVNV